MKKYLEVATAVQNLFNIIFPGTYLITMKFGNWYRASEIIVRNYERNFLWKLHIKKYLKVATMMKIRWDISRFGTGLKQCTWSSERSYERNLQNLTTIKSNKLRFKKYFKKSHFLSQKLIFHCFKQKILPNKVNFFLIFVHMNVQNFGHILKHKYCRFIIDQN